MVVSYGETFEAIKDAHRITVIGGGPVGIELVGEIKAAYPTKEITLIHNGVSSL